jgi:hypothetical protein
MRRRIRRAAFEGSLGEEERRRPKKDRRRSGMRTEDYYGDVGEGAKAGRKRRKGGRDDGVECVRAACTFALRYLSSFDARSR